jgi:hypothetical protein
LHLAPSDSIISVVAPKRRHTRYIPQFPLATPESDLEQIIRKGNAPQEGISTVVSGDYGNLHDSSLKTPVAASHSPIIPSIGVSRSLNFRSFPIEFSPSRPHLEENFDTHVSPEIVKWFKPRNLEGCPTLVFPTPPPIIVTASKEGETYFPLNPISFSPNNQLFPFSPRNTVPVSPVRTPSPPGSPTIHIPMASYNPPIDKMDAIVVARYAPLVLPQPMNSLLVGDKVKYMPKFIGEEDITAEEHISTFYRFANIQLIENEYVWMRDFVQSLDGEARKWFRDLPPRSIDGIKSLDDSFLRHWGIKNISFIILHNLGHLRDKRGNLFQDSQRDVIRCKIRFPLKLIL